MCPTYARTYYCNFAFVSFLQTRSNPFTFVAEAEIAVVSTVTRDSNDNNNVGVSVSKNDANVFMWYRVVNVQYCAVQSF